MPPAADFCALFCFRHSQGSLSACGKGLALLRPRCHPHGPSGIGDDQPGNILHAIPGKPGYSGAHGPTSVIFSAFWESASIRGRDLSTSSLAFR